MPVAVAVALGVGPGVGDRVALDSLRVSSAEARGVAVAEGPPVAVTLRRSVCEALGRRLRVPNGDSEAVKGCVAVAEEAAVAEGLPDAGALRVREKVRAKEGERSRALDGDGASVAVPVEPSVRERERARDRLRLSIR